MFALQMSTLTKPPWPAPTFGHNFGPRSRASRRNHFEIKKLAVWGLRLGHSLSSRLHELAWRDARTSPGDALREVGFDVLAHPVSACLLAPSTFSRDVTACYSFVHARLARERDLALICDTHGYMFREACALICPTPTTKDDGTTETDGRGYIESSAPRGRGA